MESDGKPSRSEWDRAPRPPTVAPAGRSGDNTRRPHDQDSRIGPGRWIPVDLDQPAAGLVAVLGLKGPCGREELIGALWGGRAISTSRFANLLAEVRAVVGRERLVQGADGRYRLHGVAIDADRFADLVQRACAQSPDTPGEPAADRALEQLEEAMELLDGPVLDGGERRFWQWLDDEYHRRFEIEHLVVSAGLRAAVLAMGAHQPQRARWACERCLAAVPHEERLVATLAEIHLAQGRRRHAAELVAAWEQAVRRLGLGEPPPGRGVCSWTRHDEADRPGMPTAEPDPGGDRRVARARRDQKLWEPTGTAVTTTLAR